MKDSRFTQVRLANGLTVVIEVMPAANSAACGFLARTGSRDESRELAGVSHFLEHMMFKGTARRRWQDITVEFDEMGAQYNAYTSKDRTFYYGWVRPEDIERQMALLADMMRSTLPADELEVERNVILEEIAMSNDDLSSNAYDSLYAGLCQGSSLEWPILGFEETVAAMTREQMEAHFRRRYAPNNLVLVVAGSVEVDGVLAAAKRICGQWEPAADLGARRRVPQLRTGAIARQLKRFHQQAVVLACPAPPAGDPMDETAEGVAAILGGVNSRFYWNIVQTGLSTRAGACREEYPDFGLTILFGLCEPENYRKLLDAMHLEAEKLARSGPEPKELRRVKNLRRTSLASESEAPYYRLTQLVDDIDYRGAPRPPEERLAAVDTISEETVADYLQAFPIATEGFLATVGPLDVPA